MKYAVTGHTRGLGGALYRRLSPDCIGFSRAGGYDVSIAEDRKRIIAESVDCDVFINSAHYVDGQLNLLYELFNVWKDSNKIIVNIGTDATSGIKNKINMYPAYKTALAKGSEQLAHLHAPCKVLNVRYGYLGTEWILENINPDNYIVLEDAVEYLLQQVEWCKKYRIIDCLMVS